MSNELLSLEDTIPESNNQPGLNQCRRGPKQIPLRFPGSAQHDYAQTSFNGVERNESKKEQP